MTWSGGGNVNPLLGLTGRLVERGVAVTVRGSPDLAPRFAAVGVDFEPREPAQEWDAAATAGETRDAADRTGADALLIDYMQPAALCGAETSGLPVAAFVHTLYGALLAQGDLLTMYMATSLDDVNAVRRDLGLAPVDRMASLVDACAQVVVACPAALDVGPGPLPDNVRYVGPIVEPAGPDAGWQPPTGDRPLVVVCLGTTPMDEGPVLQRVLDGLADQPVRVMATVGAHVDQSTLRVPANATVGAFVRHAAVLPHASAVVCHAGLGTVNAALAHGVPLVCLPLGRDQPDNARAVERVRAGRALPPESARADIAAAVADVLAGGRYRAAAQAIADECDVEHAAPAVAAIETLFGRNRADAAEP
jgi:UDP:flavonoid glycosyltransferase YjiC (YdhE family)